MNQDVYNRMGKQDAAASDRIRIAPAEDCARYILRIPAAGLAHAEAAFGVGLPAAVNTMNQSDSHCAICLGPDEWLLLAPLAEAPRIEQGFAALYDQCPHSLVDIGHREVGIEIRGEAAALALNSACPRDLDAMPAGSATRTIFDKAQIVLIKHTVDFYRIEVWRSFAAHVQGLLAAASQEIALNV